MSDVPHVKLGAHSLPVYDQPWKRIVKRLGMVLDALQGAADPGGDLDTGQFIQALGPRLYETFVTFIPNLPEFLPEHEFNGYTSPQRWREDVYDEFNDPSPTLPQLIGAFETVVEVNGGKRLTEHLGKVFDPKMLRAEASLALSEWRERSLGSPSSPGVSEESAPSASGPSARTEEPPTTDQEIESLDFVPGPWAR